MINKSYPAPTIATPIRGGSGTPTTVVILVVPPLATHHIGRKVTARRFAIATTPTGMTPSSEQQTLPRHI